MKPFHLILLLLLAANATAFSADLKFAIIPMQDPRKLMPPLQILTEYLSEATGETITPIVTRNYNEMFRRLQERSVDLAWLNTNSYVKLRKTLPSLQYVCTYMERNKNTGQAIPCYHSYIITLKQTGLDHLEALEGRRFAFTDVESTSGYAFPAMMLRRRGIEPASYFQKVFFLKRHDRVIEALVNGAVDAGAVSDGTYHTAVQQHGDIFTILLKSDPIPLDAIVAPAHIAAERVELYRRLLAAIDGDHPFNISMEAHLGWPAAGFEVMDDSLYDGYREALQE